MDLSTTFASLRKQVAGLSLVALVAGMLATGVATAQTTGNIFSDVPADAWFAPYVNGLSEAGVVDSTKDMYRPSDLVNRAEMAKFAFMVSGLPLETAAEAPYTDVAMGQWYTDYVYTLTKNGIVSGDKLNGVPTGKFRPTENLNRAEASKMLVNAAQMAEDLSGAPHFPDVTSSDWYYNYVETLFNNGVIAGYPDGYFRPANNINRAEAAKMVYLSMNPVSAGFTLDSAAAASKTKVELIFSMNVDETLAADEANYLIEDSSGNKLNVTAAEVVAADTVHLTTATQTEGKVYYVTAKNLESDAGDALANMDSVSFLGYGADVSGGALSVALSSQTPVAGSIPMGATGVVFTCWDFKAGSEAAVVKSLRVHRVGPGSQEAFTNVYLYRGDSRVTTGRSINSESQMTEFSNINQTISAGENVKMCLVADLATAGVNGGVHAFELVSADDVSSNSADLTGSFPLRGADQLVTNATVGQTTVKRSGSLDEITIGETDARIAQFELSANGSEDQMLTRMALYVRGRVTSSALSNLKLYTEGESAALATTDGIGDKDLATFVLSKPFKISRGQTKIFYVTADISGARNGDDIKVYIDESTDVYVTGVTYGYGTQVDIGTVGTYDGAEDLTDGYSAGDKYSYTTIKGSKFNMSFTGPVASDIAVNQKQARCLDLTLTNAAGTDVEIKDWKVDLAITTAEDDDGTDATGLYNNTTPNFTLVKLAKLNDDGSVSGTLLGSNELPAYAAGATSGDATAQVTMKGTASIASGESVKVSVVFDVANEGLLDAQKIRCSLPTVVGTITDTNNDQLSAAEITPTATIPGNIMTLVKSALDITKSNNVINNTVVKGTNDAALAAFQFKAGSSLNQTVKSLSFHVARDTDNDLGTLAADFDEVADATAAKDIVTTVGLYDGTTLVSDLKSLDSNGDVVFNNLNIAVAKSQTKVLTLKGNISSSLTSPANGIHLSAYLKSGTTISIDQNQQTVTGASIGDTAVDGLIELPVVTITNGSTGTTSAVAPSSTVSAIAGVQTLEALRFKITSSNGAATLNDFRLAVNAGVGYNPELLNEVYLAKVESGVCGANLVSGTIDTVGNTVKFENAGITLANNQDTVLCVKVVNNEIPSSSTTLTSGDMYQLDLIAFSAAGLDEILSGAGENIADAYTLSGAVSSRDITVFRSMPQLAGQTLSSTTLTSSGYVAKFTISAVGQTVGVNELHLAYSGSAGNTLNGATCKLYNGANEVDPAAASISLVAAGGALDITGIPGESITAGSSNSYSVYCSGITVAAGTGSTLTTLFETGVANAIVWDDGTTASPISAGEAVVTSVIEWTLSK